MNMGVVSLAALLYRPMCGDGKPNLRDFQLRARGVVVR